jgi:RNA polymerase sigma-70 factor, ECF subfamily
MSELDIIVRAHEETVLKTAGRLSGQRDDAKDAAQEVFLRWFRNGSRIRGDLGAWLYRVTVNVCNDHYRRGRPPTELRACHPDPAPTPESPMKLKEQRRIIAEAPMKLSRKERIVVVLRHIGGLSSIETAAMLKASAATVRGRSHSARRKLAACLKAERRT